MDISDQYQRTRQLLFDREGIQPESKFISTQGQVKNIHYLKIGSGKPLILIHGGGSHASEWINVLKPLSQHYQLYVVDRPGSGLSDKINYQGVNVSESAVDFVSSFMDALGLKKASILGQSMGGYFSICFAMQYPKRVETLILIGAPAGMNTWIPLLLRLLGTRLLNKILTKTIAKPSIKSTRDLHRQLLVDDIMNVSEVYLEHVYHNQIIPGNATSFISLLENVLTLNGWRQDLYIGDQLDQLQIPVRFIWGDNDAFESPDSGKPKTAGIQDCQFEVVKNAGHCPWLDQPEQCVHLAMSMLKGESNLIGR